MAAEPDLYLASKSPRRSLLLTEAGLRFALCEPGAEYVDGATELQSQAGDPGRLALERAHRKAAGAAPPRDDVPVLAVDTVVDLDGQELGKAADRDAAEAMLRRLSGRTHSVHTAHVLQRSGNTCAELVTSRVQCARADDERVRAYLDSGQWRGKAGAYGIQDPGQDFFQLVDGAYDNVVGLHVAAVLRLLHGACEEGRA